MVHYPLEVIPIPDYAPTEDFRNAYPVVTDPDRNTWAIQEHGHG